MTTEFDIIVAGGGIAGLSAALSCARLGRKTLVLTGGLFGGQLLSINKVEGYPGFPDGVAGYDLCPMVQEEAAASGVEFAASELANLAPQEGRWRIVTSAGEDYLAPAIILATGASLKQLGVPGETRLMGKGVSHCASCDAPLLRDRIVAVIGGGDSATQEALTLAECAKRVIILQRGAALTAQASFRDRVTAEPKIELRCNTTVEEILGEAKVTGVRLRDGATGAAANLDLDGVFIYIGLRANTDFLAGQIAMDEAGCLPTDNWMRTARPGLCAIGAVRSGSPGRAVASAGEGATAAIALDRYLAEASWCAHG